MFSPQGVYAAMLTPLDDKKRVNTKVVREMVDFYIEKGVKGIFPVSNVGEFIFLDEEDKRLFVDVVVDQAAGRAKVIPGISSGTMPPEATMQPLPPAIRVDRSISSQPTNTLKSGLISLFKLIMSSTFVREPLDSLTAVILSISMSLLIVSKDNSLANIGILYITMGN